MRSSKRKRSRVHPLVAWGYYSAEELKVLPPGKRDEILSLLQDIRAGRRHSADTRALLRVIDPFKFGDPSGGQSKLSVPANNLRELSPEEKAECAAEYARLSAEAHERRRLTEGDNKDFEEPSYVQAGGTVDYVDTSQPSLPKQSQEPELSAVEREFLSNTGYRAHGPRRRNDSDSGWRTPALPGEDRGESSLIPYW
jgi:hypothetical protein